MSDSPFGESFPRNVLSSGKSGPESVNILALEAWVRGMSLRVDKIDGDVDAIQKKFVEFNTCRFFPNLPIQAAAYLGI